MNSKPSKTLAIVSLVLSIVSVPAFCVSFIPLLGCVFFPLSSSLALAGAITGFLGLQKVKAGTASGKGLAMGGMITGIAVIVLNLIGVVLVMLVFGAAAAGG
jgi:hypothetical protein